MGRVDCICKGRGLEAKNPNHALHDCPIPHKDHQTQTSEMEIFSEDLDILRKAVEKIK